MSFHKSLLAGVALPFIALSLVGPAAAANMRPAMAIEANSLVLKVSDVSDAKRRLKAAREALAAAKASGGDVEGAKAAVQAARADLEAATANGGNQDQNQNLDQNQNQDQNQDQTNKKRRKQQQQQQEQDQVQQDQTQQDQQQVDQNQQDQNQLDRQKIKKLRQKQKQDQQDQQQLDQNQADQNQVIQDVPADQGQKVKKNRDKTNKSANDNGANNDGQVEIQNPDGSIQIIDTQKKKRERKAQQNAEDQLTPKTDKDVQRMKQLAKDPTKTTDTIELPIVNGAPVLDSEKDIANTGDQTLQLKRKKQRENMGTVVVPKTDQDAQREFRKRNKDIKIDAILEVPGEKITVRPKFDQPNARTVNKGGDVRVIFNINNQVVVRSDDNNRLVRNDARVRYEALDGGRIREIVTRPDGTRVVTVRNKFGEIIRRSHIDARGREYVIFYSPELERGRGQLFLRDPGYDLPPMRLVIPVEDYIIDTSSEPNRNFRDFLARPPVEQVERVYSLDEVKYSARIRDKVRRIDLDTITFQTGSADISMDQASSLRRVADAIKELLDRDPGETFLIEGHTDAVGSDESNLVLSDMRAESVANILTDVYDIPAENLATQGYGERFLKVDTDGPERLNRRVTIRRVTALVRPQANVD